MPSKGKNSGQSRFDSQMELLREALPAMEKQQTASQVRRKDKKYFLRPGVNQKTQDSEFQKANKNYMPQLFKS